MRSGLSFVYEDVSGVVKPYIVVSRILNNSLTKYNLNSITNLITVYNYNMFLVHVLLYISVITLHVLYNIVFYYTSI